MASFRLLTLNIFGTARTVAGFLRWRGIPSAERLAHPKMRDLVASVDIACFQEVFLAEAEEFFDSLPHDTKHRDTNHTEWLPLTFGGSGLGLVSRFRRIEGSLVRFLRPQAHAERFARKGMLHAALDVEGERVDVITTHMQAGIAATETRVRLRQIDELAAMVERIRRDDAACIVCGDLNIDGMLESNAEFRHLRKALAGFEDLGSHEGAPTFVPRKDGNPLAHLYDADHPVQRIDYVWFRPPTNGKVRAAGPVRVLREALDTTRDPPLVASDHFGLLATFEIG